MSDPPPLPEPSFSGLIDMLGAQAFVALGGYAPDGGKASVDLAHAQFIIELMRILRTKTESGRTDDETKRLDETIDNLQRGWVTLKQKADS